MATRVIEMRSTPAPASRTAAACKPSDYSARWSVVLIAADLAMFLVSSYVAGLLVLVRVYHWGSPFDQPRFVAAQVVYVLVWLFIFSRLGLYRRSFALSVKDELYYTGAALLLGTLPQLLLFTIVPSISTSRGVIALSLPLSFVLVAASRAAIHHWRTAPRVRQRRIAVVGHPDRILAAYSSLALAAAEDPVLLAVDDIAPLDEPCAAAVDELDWFQEVRRRRCDTLIFTEVPSPAMMPQLLEAAAVNGISIALAPPRIQCHAYTLSLQFEGQQALLVPGRLRACTPRAYLHKRLMDVTLALLALTVFAPAMLAAAIAVYVESGHPIVFRQRRVGLRGKTFDILKFRSMRPDAETESGAVWARAHDPRKTRVGAWLRRLSFDELPQLFNVLAGDMSLVGPRPERPEFVELFRRTLPRYDERHLVLPGITGWSQIHMKRLLSPSDAEEKLRYDLQYVENWSPFLDISVLFETLFEFLFHRAG